jgi:hypothetical protein
MSSWSGGRGPVDNVPISKVITMSPIPIVSVVMKGGFGNRLFQILAGLGYAKRTGKRFVFIEKKMQENFHSSARLTKDFLAALFPNVKFYRGIVDYWDHYYEGADDFYNDALIEDCSGISGSSGSSGSSRNVLLHGYFQNAAHFPADYRPLFKVPKPAIISFDSAAVNFTKTYFIHFRLGDYVDSDYDVNLAFYYKKVLSMVPSDVTFLVFSDQPEKLKMSDYFSDSGRYKIVLSGLWETLYLMSLCAGAICANSTFSWFGAYACKGSVNTIYMPTIWKKGATGSPVPNWATAVSVIPLPSTSQ